MKLSDWLDPMCRSWGLQKRCALLNLPRSRSARAAGHVEGWPEVTLLCRIKDEKYGACHSSGQVVQYFPEVYVGDGLKIHRAIQDMPESPRLVVGAHYVVINLPAKAKAMVLGISRTQYFHELDCGYHFLAGKIDEIGVGALSPDDSMRTMSANL